MEIINILSEIDFQTLVVFDIDYTLFRSKTNLGMPEWIHYFIEKEILMGLSKEEAFHKWYPIWLKAQEIIEIELMDDKIPQLLKELQKMSAGFIGLTARGYTSAKVTLKQLNQLGLNLDTTPISQHPISFTFEYPVIFEKGILFIH